MNIFRWILHPISFLLLIVAVAFYLNRAELFSEPKVAPVTAESESNIPAADASPVTNSDAPHEQAAMVASIETTREIDAVIQEAGAISPERETVVAATATEEPEADVPVSASEPAAAMVVEEAGARQPHVQPNMMGQMPMMPPGQATRPEPPRHIQLLYAARRAAWSGEFDSAVESYRALIELQPENYNVHGELGDLYLRTGEVDKALDAYEQAALLLKKANRTSMAWSVLNYVGRISAERGDALRDKLINE